MKEPRWINTRALILLHAESLAEHGGLTGLRDENGFHAGMARPQHVFHYKPDADLSRLAAAYGFGLVRDHPFTDGNKRAGFLAILLFLDLNGLELQVAQPEAIQTILALAAGRMSESALGKWIRDHVRRTRKR